MTEDTVVVRLSYDEALVLFEWLSVMGERDSCGFAHPAEEMVLWKIEGLLERSLLALLQPDYDALLQQARERVAGGREDRNLE